MNFGEKKTKRLQDGAIRKIFTPTINPKIKYKYQQKYILF